ncbi:MAG: hypothetical protein ACJ74J_10055 [Blastocatellia bacterium]
MAIGRTEKLLRQALLNNGEMEYELYKYEMEELMDEWKASMAKDKDDYLFAVTENNGHVAMILIEKSGRVHINEGARERLKELWPVAYESNMEKLIPAFAKQLAEGEIPVNGVKIVGANRKGRA